jgi:1-acylglycerone phosphate reductase
MSTQKRFALVTGLVSHDKKYCIYFTNSELYSCGRGGIGEALVTEYKRKGLHPIATVLPFEASDHLTDAGITFYKLDVTSEKSILEMKAEVQKLTNGRLDVLVNCA